jgi:hypothetical protein
VTYIRKLFFVVIAQFLLASLCSAQNDTLTNGTLIITLTSQDTIWIGADTRTSSLTDKGYTVNKKGMCKIYSTNDIIYAMAGHVRYVDNSFNFLEIMQAAINEQQNFDRSMEAFQQRAKIEINSILKKFSRKSINTLINTNNGSFLSVVAISFNNDKKKMKEMKFSIGANNSNNWSVNYKTTEDSGVGSLKFVGHATNALKFVRDNNLYFGNGKNMPGKISELIELESKATTTVGMPVDVISIYNGGYKRVINSGLCSE